jgi:hypothetical protein
MQNFQSSFEGGCLSAFMGLLVTAGTLLGNAVSIANRVETHANIPEKLRN